MYAGPSDQVCELLPSTEEKGQSRRAQPSMILCSGSGDLPSKSLTAHAHHTLMESGLTGPGNARMAKAGLWAFPFSAKIVYRALGGVGEKLQSSHHFFSGRLHTHIHVQVHHIYTYIYLTHTPHKYTYPAHTHINTPHMYMQTYHIHVHVHYIHTYASHTYHTNMHIP